MIAGTIKPSMSSWTEFKSARGNRGMSGKSLTSESGIVSWFSKSPRMDQRERDTFNPR